MVLTARYAIEYHPRSASYLIDHPVPASRWACFYCVCRVHGLHGNRDAYPTLDDKAMFAESNMRPCYFRYGYDIALPLRAKAFFYNLRGTAPQDRKYFATFKVSRGVEVDM